MLRTGIFLWGPSRAVGASITASLFLLVMLHLRQQEPVFKRGFSFLLGFLFIFP